MARVLTDTQTEFRRSVRALLHANSPVSEHRRLRNEADPDGLSRKLWRQMATLGCLGLDTDPADTGDSTGTESELGGMAELGLVLEQCGRQLAATPMISCILLSSRLLTELGTKRQRALLTEVATGDLLIATAYQEGSRHNPEHVDTVAQLLGDQLSLSGEKRFVIDGHIADWLLVSANIEGLSEPSLGILLGKADSPGVDLTRTTLIDGRNSATVRLNDVKLPRNAVLGDVSPPPHHATVLEEVLARAALAQAAEMMGIAAELFERTQEHLRTREQFGQKLASFQALKHRIAHWYIELELSRSVLMDANSGVDEGRDDWMSLAHHGKARLGRLCSLATAEAVQLHGGIGVTDESDIGLFLKRAKVAELTLGDSSFHTDAYARRLGI